VIDEREREREIIVPREGTNSFPVDHFVIPSDLLRHLCSLFLLLSPPRRTVNKLFRISVSTSFVEDAVPQAT